MKAEELETRLNIYLADRRLKKDSFTSSLMPFFIGKARHNLETACLIWKILDNLSTKEKLAIRHDYEAYDWVISTAYYAMYHAASAALAAIGLRSSNHHAVIDALEYHFVHKRSLLEGNSSRRSWKVKSWKSAIFTS